MLKLFATSPATYLVCDLLLPLINGFVCKEVFQLTRLQSAASCLGKRFLTGARPYHLSCTILELPAFDHTMDEGNHLWRNVTVLSFLLVLASALLASPSSLASAQAVSPSPQRGQFACQASANAIASAQSGNVSTNATVYGFPYGSPYDVQMTVTRLPGVGLVFEGEGAVLDPQAGTSKTSLTSDSTVGPDGIR